MRSARGRDAGFMTVAVLGLTTVLVAVAALLATLGTVAVARHRAAAVADLAALAGARHLLDGSSCEAAERVTRAGAAELLECRTEATSVTVVVGVRVGPLGTARVRARAGPSAEGGAGNRSGVQDVGTRAEGQLGALRAGPRGQGHHA